MFSDFRLFMLALADLRGPGGAISGGLVILNWTVEREKGVSDIWIALRNNILKLLANPPQTQNRPKCHLRPFRSQPFNYIILNNIT